MEKEMSEYVYVTIYGEVWHETTDCRYLNIEVYGADREQVGDCVMQAERNTVFVNCVKMKNGECKYIIRLRENVITRIESVLP